MRLPIIALAAIAALGLNCSGAHAGRGLSTTDNPYCDVTTYTLRDLPEQAMSTLDSNGQPGDRGELHRCSTNAGLWPLPHGA